MLKYTSVSSRQFGVGIRAAPMDLNNRDNLIGQVDGVDGLKTGFTNAAGSCLTATAQRQGRRVLVVVMGSPSAQKRDLKVVELLELGFAALPAAAPSPTESSAIMAAPPPPSPKANPPAADNPLPPLRLNLPPRRK